MTYGETSDPKRLAERAALAAATQRAEAAEAASYDIAAAAALEVQNLREALTAMRQRAEAAEREAAAARAECGRINADAASKIAALLAEVNALRAGVTVLRLILDIPESPPGLPRLPSAQEA